MWGCADLDRCLTAGRSPESLLASCRISTRVISGTEPVCRRLTQRHAKAAQAFHRITTAVPNAFDRRLQLLHRDLGNRRCDLPRALAAGPSAVIPPFYLDLAGLQSSEKLADPTRGDGNGTNTRRREVLLCHVCLSLWFYPGRRLESQDATDSSAIMH